MKKVLTPQDGSAQVDEFMHKLDHPYKSEVESIREIIKKVNNEITEQVKWNAPSFSYKGNYLVTFNLWARDRIHLVFHNPKIADVKNSLLEGDHKDRRMAYFQNMQDIEKKTASLKKVLKDLIKLQGPA